MTKINKNLTLTFNASSSHRETKTKCTLAEGKSVGQCITCILWLGLELIFQVLKMHEINLCTALELVRQLAGISSWFAATYLDRTTIVGETGDHSFIFTYNLSYNAKQNKCTEQVTRTGVVV